MTQQRISPIRPSDESLQTTDDLLTEIEARLAVHQQEAAERQTEQMVRAQMVTELDAELEDLLSENSEEFVILFLQTEGE